MIDWQKVAQQNNLTPKEFGHEILTTACATGGMMIDEVGGQECLIFKCNDGVSDLKLTIERV